jgi:hypothetical protein
VNPVLVTLGPIWVGLDILWLFALRPELTSRREVLILTQATVVVLSLTVFGAFGAPPGLAVFAFWALLGFVNGLLGLTGLGRHRVLAMIGLAGTGVALALIAAGSFASLWVIVISGAFCLASAVAGIKKAPSTRTSST